MEGCHLEDREFEGKFLDRDKATLVQQIFIEYLLQIDTGLDTGITLLNDEEELWLQPVNSVPPSTLLMVP